MKRSSRIVEPKHTRFVLPLVVCQQVARLSLAGELQLYLYLKSICDGNLHVNTKVEQAAARALGCSHRTIKRRFERLRERNWIGCYKKSGAFILRSFNDIIRIEKLEPYRTGVEFFTKNLNRMQAFVAGACIGYLSKQQRTKQWRARQSGAKNGSPHHPGTSLPLSYALACKYIAEIFNIATSTAGEWKRLASEAGFISVQKHITPLPFRSRAEYARQGYDDAHRVVYWDGRYYRQEADLVAPELHYKTRRKIRKPLKKSGQMPEDNKWVNSNKDTVVSLGKYERFLEERHGK